MNNQETIDIIIKSLQPTSKGQQYQTLQIVPQPKLFGNLFRKHSELVICWLEFYFTKTKHFNLI